MGIRHRRNHLINFCFMWGVDTSLGTKALPEPGSDESAPRFLWGKKERIV